MAAAAKAARKAQEDLERLLLAIRQWQTLAIWIRGFNFAVRGSDEWTQSQNRYSRALQLEKCGYPESEPAHFRNLARRHEMTAKACWAEAEELTASLRQIRELVFQYAPRSAYLVRTVDFLNDPPLAESELRPLVENMVKLEGELRATVAKVGAPAQQRTKPGRKSATVDDLMRLTLEENHSANQWTTDQWAEHLDCAKSTVAETPMWKALHAAHVRMAAERELNTGERADRRRFKKSRTKED